MSPSTLTAPDTLTQELTQLRAAGDEESIKKATALEREFERDNADQFDLGDETRPILEDGSAPPADGSAGRVEQSSDPAPETVAAGPGGEVAEPVATDAAKAKAAELGVDLSTIDNPSGATGAITVKDVEAAAKP